MRKLDAIRRPVATALLAIFALATLAPMAEAGSRGKQRRYKGPVYRTRVVERIHVAPTRHYVRRGGDSAGPLIAGLIGGFILGAATQASASERTVYWDPNCERRFSSFDECRAHWGRHSGARVVYQVETRSGRCVDAWRYASGDWHRWDGNPAGWDDDDDGRTWDREHRGNDDCDD